LGGLYFRDFAACIALVIRVFFFGRGTNRLSMCTLCYKSNELLLV
jgi:hypothetical protein